MTPRQRVSAALARKPVDRVPVFMAFHPETAETLGRLLEVPAEHVGDAMGNDVHQTWVNNNYAMEGIVHQRQGQSHVDEWGIRWVKHGPFNQIAESPLTDASPKQVDDYRFHSDRVDFLVDRMDAVISGEGDYYIGCDVSPCVFEMYWRLRGMEQSLLDMVTETALAYHCCGALRPIIGDLIEMGINVLHPVQCNCPGMDPLDLKREFGGRLSFMGGVDTQGLLPHGTVHEVRCATRRLIEGMTNDGGGFVLAASHTLPPETPIANVFAMFDEAGITRQQIFDRAADIRRRLAQDRS